LYWTYIIQHAFLWCA